jgi:enediyne biosynthesis protein E4
MRRQVGASGVAVGAAFLTVAAAAPAARLTFTDITRPAGIRFVHDNGAFGRKYLPETIGSGVAFFDADADGWPDLFFVDSTTWPGHPAARSVSTLYRNNRDGTFTDVTRRSGLGAPMYGIGAAAADYDNDGAVDLYITALGANHLFRNTGHGRFEDVTAAAGVGDPGFSTSAVWFDYDNDGKLDLYVANYVQWSPEKDLYCTLDGKAKSYCTPESYKGASGTLYHNRGNGTFEDVTRKAGLFDPASKALGVAMLDYDRDGWMDLFIANDTQPNRLYRNRGDGTFEDVAVTAGVAFDEAGVARAGMGVDATDYDGSGRPSLIIGNFSNQMMSLYTNEGNGLFIDEAPASSLGRSSLLTLTFGCFFFDADLDGLPDILAANGHVADDVSHVQKDVTYAEAPQLFRNMGQRKFEDLSARVGEAFRQPMVARGAAYADIDGDGDLDLAFSTNGGPAKLLRNEGGNANHWLRIRTLGTISNRDGIGAQVTITSAAGARRWALVKTGSSYASQSELPVTFGLGTDASVAAIDVRWPSGKVDHVGRTAAGQDLTIQEGRGVIRTARAVASPR